MLVVSNQSTAPQTVTFETDELGGTRGGNTASSPEIAPGATGRVTIITREGTTPSTPRTTRSAPRA